MPSPGSPVVDWDHSHHSLADQACTKKEEEEEEEEEEEGRRRGKRGRGWRRRRGV